MRTELAQRALRSLSVVALVACAAAPTVAEESADTPPPAEGMTLYLDHCAVCHGVYGEGDGVITPSLAVVLQDLRYLSARNNGEFPRSFIIEIVDGRAVRAAHGPEGMPVWGAEFARDEPFDAAAEQRVNAKIDAITDFLESIQIKEPAAR